MFTGIIEEVSTVNRILDSVLSINSSLAIEDLEIKDIFEKVSEGVAGITGVVINLVALAILVEVIYGQGIFGMGVIGNITKLVNDIGSSGFAGLVSLLVPVSYTHLTLPTTPYV